MTATLKSIAIIIPYFGDLPWYFKYFIHSCRYNSTVHFYIITDDYKYDHEVPENVFMKHKSFDDVKGALAKALQMDIALNDTYKLCDFKPVYGLAFSEYTTGYDFWGMGDIDVIYGNIRNFMTEEVLTGFDVISTHHDFLAGYFTLFRNCKLVNEIFMQSRDYKKVFTNNEHFCFDECNFAFWHMNEKIGFEDVQVEIDSMTHVVKRLNNKSILKAYFNLHAIEGIGGQIKWHEGTLSFKNEYEVMLYHMIKLKEIFTRKRPNSIPGMFRISPKRIY